MHNCIFSLLMAVLVLMAVPAALLSMSAIVALRLVANILLSVRAVGLHAVLGTSRRSMAPGIGRRAGMEVMDVVLPLHGMVHFFVMAQLAHRYGTKIAVRKAFHAFAADAGVYKPAMIKGVMVDDDAMAEGEYGAVVRDDPKPEVRFPEMVVSDEAEEARVQTEGEIGADMPAIPGPAAIYKHRARR